MKTVIEKRTGNIARYLRRIKRKLVGAPEERQRLLTDLQNSIDEYTETNPDASFADIEAHFGTPATIAADFALQAGPSFVKKHKRKKILQYLLIVLLVAVTVFAIVQAGVVVISLIKDGDNTGYFDVVVTENEKVYTESVSS